MLSQRIYYDIFSNFNLFISWRINIFCTLTFVFILYKHNPVDIGGMELLHSLL